MTTLEEVKTTLKNNWDSGISCPACGQFVKKYRRKLTTSMSVGLISLYNQSSGWGEHIHIKNIKGVNGGEFAQLRRWGLIEEVKNDDETKRTSGLWVITDKGREFVLGRVQVPGYCWTYNNKTLDFDGPLVSIKDTLGRRFNYRELMDEREEMPV